MGELVLGAWEWGVATSGGAVRKRATEKVAGGVWGDTEAGGGHGFELSGRRECSSGGSGTKAQGWDFFRNNRETGRLTRMTQPH